MSSIKSVATGLLGVIALAAMAVFIWQVALRSGNDDDGLVFANGRIEGEPVYLSSKQPGQIVKLNVEEGDAVKAGDILAQLDQRALTARLHQAKAQAAAVQQNVMAATIQFKLLKQQVPLLIAQAEATLRRANESITAARAQQHQAIRDARRFTRLAKDGTVDERQSEQAQTQLKIANAALKQVLDNRIVTTKALDDARLGPQRIARQQAQLNATREKLAVSQARVVEAQSYVDDLKLRAPINAVVISRNTNTGELVTPGMSLFELTDLNQLYLKVYVPEKYLGQVRLGAEARLYFDALEKPLLAKVTYISSQAEFTPREVQTRDERTKLVFAVKLALTENAERRIVPGMPADAAIRIRAGAPWRRPEF